MVLNLIFCLSGHETHVGGNSLRGEQGNQLGEQRRYAPLHCAKSGFSELFDLIRFEGSFGWNVAKGGNHRLGQFSSDAFNCLEVNFVRIRAVNTHEWWDVMRCYARTFPATRIRYWWAAPLLQWCGMTTALCLAMQSNCQPAVPAADSF